MMMIVTEHNVTTTILLNDENNLKMKISMYSDIGYGKGIWAYVQGGMGAVTQALTEINKELGVDVYTNAQVKQFTVNSNTNRCTGVVLEDGTEITATKAVASNCDPHTTFRKVSSSSGSGGHCDELLTSLTHEYLYILHLALTHEYIILLSFMNIYTNNSFMNIYILAYILILSQTQYFFSLS